LDKSVDVPYMLVELKKLGVTKVWQSKDKWPIHPDRGAKFE